MLLQFWTSEEVIMPFLGIKAIITFVVKYYSYVNGRLIKIFLFARSYIIDYFSWLANASSSSDAWKFLKGDFHRNDKVTKVKFRTLYRDFDSSCKICWINSIFFLIFKFSSLDKNWGRYFSNENCWKSNKIPFI